MFTKLPFSEWSDYLTTCSTDMCSYVKTDGVNSTLSCLGRQIELLLIVFLLIATILDVCQLQMPVI